MGQPTKVLWISCVGEKGGAEVYMLNFLRHLDRRRFMPVVAMLRPGPLADELRELDVPVFHFAVHRMRNLAAVGKTITGLGAMISKEGIGLVHSNGFRGHVYGGLAAWRAGVPEVWSVHTVEKPGWLTGAIFRIPSTHVTANCPRTADYFVGRGLPTNLIWPGVDEDYLEQGTSRTTLAQSFSLPMDARWVSLGARLQRYKGHEYFIRAIASLPPDLNDVHGIIIGGALFGMEQTYLAELKALAERLGVERRVHFTGFISDADVHGLLAASELLVHPALDEDFGLIVAEAQALGKPVLAFATVGPSAIVAAEKTGRLVPIGDQAQLNQAFADLLSQPERLQRWGQAGRERARRLFNARALTLQLERVYASCLRSRNRAPALLEPGAVASVKSLG